jgi:hypothetical protein
MLAMSLRALLLVGWIALIAVHVHTVVLPSWGLVRSTDMTAVLSTHLNHSYHYRVEGADAQILGTVVLDCYLDDTLILCRQTVELTDIGPFLKPAAGQLRNLAGKVLPNGLDMGGTGTVDISGLLGLLITGGLKLDTVLAYDDRSRPVWLQAEARVGSQRGEAELTISPRGTRLRASGADRRYSNRWRQPDQNDVDSLFPLLLLPPDLQPGDRYALRCLGIDVANGTPSIQRYVVSVAAIPTMSDRVQVTLSADGRASAVMIVDPRGVPQEILISDSPFRLILDEHRQQELDEVDAESAATVP